MPQDDQALRTRLRESGLPFVVIGGVCVVFHGVPMATFDLDICCPFGEEIVRRIAAAVGEFHPVHRLTTKKLPLKATHDRFADFKNNVSVFLCDLVQRRTAKITLQTPDANRIK